MLPYVWPINIGIMAEQHRYIWYHIYAVGWTGLWPGSIGTYAAPHICGPTISALTVLLYCRIYAIICVAEQYRHYGRVAPVQSLPHICGRLIRIVAVQHWHLCRDAYMCSCVTDISAEQYRHIHAGTYVAGHYWFCGRAVSTYVCAAYMRRSIIGTVADRQRCISRRIYVHSNYRLWEDSNIQIHIHIYATRNCNRTQVYAHICNGRFGYHGWAPWTNVCPRICGMVIPILWKIVLDIYVLAYMRLTIVIKQHCHIYGSTYAVDMYSYLSRQQRHVYVSHICDRCYILSCPIMIGAYMCTHMWYWVAYMR